MSNQNAAMRNLVKAINYRLEKEKSMAKQTVESKTAMPFTSTTASQRLTMADVVGRVVASISKS